MIVFEWTLSTFYVNYAKKYILVQKTEINICGIVHVKVASEDVGLSNVLKFSTEYLKLLTPAL